MKKIMKKSKNTPLIHSKLFKNGNRIKTNTKTIIITLLLITCATAAFSQQKNKAKEKRLGLPKGMLPEEVSVMVFEVKQMPKFREITPIMGTFKPSEQIELKFPERGIVKEVYVKEGDSIEKGDILAELEEREFILKKEYADNKYKSEQSLLQSMRKEYEIKKSLHEKGAILKEKLEELGLKIEAQGYKTESSKKELELAKDSLTKIKLFSNIKGKVEKKEIEPGEFVGPEVKAFTLIKIDRVYAEAGITEKDISKIKKNLEAEIQVDAYPDDLFKGIITNISAIVFGSSRTLTVKIEIDNASYDYKILPGMFLRGEIILVELADVYVIPTDTLLELAKNTYAVYTLTPTEDYSRRDLEEGVVKGTINLDRVTLSYKGSDYSCVKGLKDNKFVIIRSEGSLMPGITGKIINVEEYEEM